MLDQSRRKFIALLGGATAWPLAARAQQPALPVVGFLNNQSLDAYERFVVAFRQGLRQIGYVEGRNVVIQYRWGQNDSSRLPGLAAELVRLPVAVLVASGGDPAILAAKAATENMPIVATIGNDPVETGLVQSLNRPGGNITGISVFAVQLVAKRLELAHELAPNAAAIAFLVNPTNPNSRIDTAEIDDAARTLGRRVAILEAGTEAECDAAFARLSEDRAGALIVESDPFFNKMTDRLVALARRHSVPVIYPRREFAAVGGLISYGSSLTEAYRQVGIYTGRVLKGDKPADLPILLPTRFELIVNLKTASAFGITMPTSILLRADEVIE
jgi:putative ABC transport system substrate-binding protein